MLGPSGQAPCPGLGHGLRAVGQRWALPTPDRNRQILAGAAAPVCSRDRLPEQQCWRWQVPRTADAARARGVGRGQCPGARAGSGAARPPAFPQPALGAGARCRPAAAAQQPPARVSVLPGLQCRVANESQSCLSAGGSPFSQSPAHVLRRAGWHSPVRRGPGSLLAQCCTGGSRTTAAFQVQVNVTFLKYPNCSWGLSGMRKRTQYAGRAWT